MLRKREITKQYENNKITVRVEKRKTKNGVVWIKNRSRQFSLCTVIFAIIAKIRYDSENSLS